MRKDQKRNSEEEAGILRRSRWISSNQQKFRWLEGQTRFLYNFRENLLEKDKKKKGRRKGGKKTKIFSFVLIPATVWASLVFGFINVLSWKMFYET